MSVARHAILLSELSAPDAEAVHEDREVVLVRAPGLSVSELETVVVGLWKRPRAGRSHTESA